jgi:hypothetical protein
MDQAKWRIPSVILYEVRLVELLDTFTRRGSDESIAAIHRALEQGVGYKS